MFEVMHKCSLTGQLCPSTHKDAGTQPCNLCPVTFPERKEPNAGVAIPRPGHSWRDFGQLGGKNVSWCSRCDSLAFTGQEPDAPCGVGGTPAPSDGDYYSEEAADIAESKARNAGVAVDRYPTVCSQSPMDSESEG